MGVLDFIAAGYLAKRAHNVANKPHVTVPDGIEILSLKAKGMNEYVIKYRTKGLCLVGGSFTGTDRLSFRRVAIVILF